MVSSVGDCRCVGLCGCCGLGGWVSWPVARSLLVLPECVAKAYGCEAIMGPLGLAVLCGDGRCPASRLGVMACAGCR